MYSRNSVLPDAMPNGSSCPANNIGDLVLAMCYVPVQEWTDVYDTDTALSRGTIFPCLDKPFIGERVDLK